MVGPPTWQLGRTGREGRSSRWEGMAVHALDRWVPLLGRSGGSGRGKEGEGYSHAGLVCHLAALSARGLEDMTWAE